jgi:hypothetical protein
VLPKKKKKPAGSLKRNKTTNHREKSQITNRSSITQPNQVVAPAKVVERAEILRKKAENNTTELNSTLNK